MKRSNKKGFTIVELVIVIAIIAILAAVLIPTFASLIQKANESKDTQLVKNLNTALAADNKEHKTMTEALAAAAEFGYDVGKINASATGNEILWDSKNDVFCYLKGDKVEYIPETSLKNGAVDTNETYKLWKIYDKAADVPETQKYSIYWNSTENFTAPLTVGFDAGECTAITTLNYVRTGDKQDVVIRTNGGVLTVNAPADTVYHYGAANKAIITEVAPDSYHEYGEVKGDIVITKGHVVLESTASVGTIVIANEATANGVKLSNNSAASIILIDADNKISADSKIGESSIKVTDNDAVALIGEKSYKTIEEAFNAAQNGDTVKLIADYRISDSVVDEAGARLVINKEITLDFGHYHVIAPAKMGGYNNNFSALYVDANTTFIAEEDGGIVCEYDESEIGPYGANVRNGAKLTIKSGTYIGGGTVVQVQKGTLEILDGKFKATPYTQPQYAYFFTINCIDAAFKDGSAKMIIKGGSFYKFDPSNSKSENPHGEFTQDGYKVNSMDDWYTVVPE